jgi:hypothetical protein
MASEDIKGCFQEFQHGIRGYQGLFPGFSTWYQSVFFFDGKPRAQISVVARRYS